MKKHIYYYISLIASLVVVFVFFSYSNPFTKQSKIVTVPPPPEDTTLTLFFVGDLMGHEPMINAAKISNKDSFEYNHWLPFYYNNIPILPLINLILLFILLFVSIIMQLGYK